MARTYDTVPGTWYQQLCTCLSSVFHLYVAMIHSQPASQGSQSNSTKHMLERESLVVVEITLHPTVPSVLSFILRSLRYSLFMFGLFIYLFVV